MSHFKSLRSRRHRQRRPRRGAMVVLLAVTLVIFIVAIAFSVDIAYMQLHRTKMRVATDAAARAAVEALARKQSMSEARNAAKDVVKRNYVGGVPMKLETEQIEFGHASRQPDGSWDFSLAGTPTNAVRINSLRTSESTLGSIPLIFGRLLGRDDFELRINAVAVRVDRDVCVVVDRSSSMKLDVTETASGMSTTDPRFCQKPGPDSRWVALDAAVDVFLDTLTETSQVENVGLVSYGSTYTDCTVTNNETDIDCQLTSSHGTVRSAVDSITNRVFNGGTFTGSGIDRGMEVLTHPTLSRPFAFKTMILMTDGHKTGGPDPITSATNAAAAGIMVHSITFGDGADEAEMELVAEAGNGRHFHATTAAELADVFREIALTLPGMITE